MPMAKRVFELLKMNFATKRKTITPIAIAKTTPNTPSVEKNKSECKSSPNFRKIKSIVCKIPLTIPYRSSTTIISGDFIFSTCQIFTYQLISHFDK